MNVSQEDILGAYEALCRPARSSCQMRHENLMRDDQGKVIYEDYEDEQRKAEIRLECDPDDRHFGCPHLLKQYSTKIIAVLNGIGDDESVKLAAELGELTKQQLANDKGIRDVRLGEFDCFDPDETVLPNADTIRELGLPILNNFTQTCGRLEELRLKAFDKVLAALEAGKLL